MDYYLHASSAQAAAILSSVKGRLTANGNIRPTGLFSKPDPGKDEKILQFRERYIQELLGHKSSKTTEIYTHVSEKSLVSVIKIKIGIK